MKVLEQQITVKESAERNPENIGKKS